MSEKTPLLSNEYSVQPQKNVNHFLRDCNIFWKQHLKPDSRERVIICLAKSCIIGKHMVYVQSNSLLYVLSSFIHRTSVSYSSHCRKVCQRLDARYSSLWGHVNIARVEGPSGLQNGFAPTGKKTCNSSAKFVTPVTSPWLGEIYLQFLVERLVEMLVKMIMCYRGGIVLKIPTSNYFSCRVNYIYQPRLWSEACQNDAATC